MNRKTALIAFNLTGIGLFTKTFLFDIVRVSDDSFDPLIPRGSWLVITKRVTDHPSDFMYYYSPKDRRHKLGYKICDEFEWMNEKSSRFLFKISQNNIGFDTYNDHTTTILNKSFVAGKVMFVLNKWQSLSPEVIGPKIEHSRFSIQPWNNPPMH